jgi:hypothetical protein
MIHDFAAFWVMDNNTVILLRLYQARYENSILVFGD